MEYIYEDKTITFLQCLLDRSNDCKYDMGNGIESTSILIVPCPTSQLPISKRLSNRYLVNHVMKDGYVFTANDWSLEEACRLILKQICDHRLDGNCHGK